MTDWESRYQVGDMPWEKGQASPPLLELLERPVDWGAGPVLVPGCGFGHDVRALGVLGIPVVGLDLAPTAVAATRFCLACSQPHRPACGARSSRR